MATSRLELVRTSPTSASNSPKLTARRNWAWVPVWSQIEVDIGIVTACLPCLSPLLRLAWTGLSPPQSPRVQTPSMMYLPGMSSWDSDDEKDGWEDEKEAWEHGAEGSWTHGDKEGWDARHRRDTKGWAGVAVVAVAVVDDGDAEKRQQEQGQSQSQSQEQGQKQSQSQGIGVAITKVAHSQERQSGEGKSWFYDDEGDEDADEDEEKGVGRGRGNASVEERYRNM